MIGGHEIRKINTVQQTKADNLEQREDATTEKNICKFVSVGNCHSADKINEILPSNYLTDQKELIQGKNKIK